MYNTIRQMLVTGGVVLSVLAGLVGAGMAQQEQQTEEATPQVITVPDVTGLDVPVAQAQLNRAGLRLGTVTPVAWSTATGDKNTVSSQTPAAGDTAEPGTPVQLDVLRDYNLLLEYNQLRLTMLNRSGQRLNIERVRLQRTETDTATEALSSARWPAFLREQQCVQVWSVATDSFVQPDICEFIQGGGWFVTTDRRNHVWFGDDPSATFDIFQDGLRRATCPVATGEAFIQCDAYIAPGTVSDDTTEYVYFIYDTHTLLIVNRSETEWMPLQEVRLTADIQLDSLRLYDDDPVDDPAFLAPGQCVRLRDNTLPDEQTNNLSDCTVIGTATLDTDRAFWRDGFSINSVVLDDVRDCPPVQNNQRTLCLLPR